MVRQTFDRWQLAEKSTHGSLDDKDSSSLVVLRTDNDMVHLAARCGHCGGIGCLNDWEQPCKECSGEGWYGIDPSQRTDAQPGSAAKIAILASRYRAGLPLWNPRDGKLDPRNGNAGKAPQDAIKDYIDSLRRGGAILAV